MYQCKYCNKVCKNNNSLVQHEIRCKLNPDKIKIRNLSGKDNPNYGNLGKNQYTYANENNLPKPEISEETHLKLSIAKRKFRHTKESIAKLKKNAGGLRRGAGRGKRGWYHNIWCDSSWELAFVIYCKDYNIQIERNSQSFIYVYKGTRYKYYPDFIVNGDFIEIKGYRTKKWEAKESQFPNKLTVYDYKKMKPILEYVRINYGNDFINLYQNRT